jgi:WD40 repeat protein
MYVCLFVRIRIYMEDIHYLVLDCNCSNMYVRFKNMNVCMYVYVYMYCVYECMYVCAQSWDLSKDFLAHDDYLLRCVISPHGRTIATTSADKTVKLWYVKVCVCMYV